MKGQDAYVAKALTRALRKAGLTHEEMAIALDCERSLVSKQLAGLSPIDANKLDIWIDMTGSVEVAQLILHRVGYQAVPIGCEAQPITIRQGYFQLMRETGAACAEADAAMLDDAIDGDEAERMRERLQAIIDVAQDTKARLPRPDAKAVARRTTHPRR